jgi:hypothetical protein
VKIRGTKSVRDKLATLHNPGFSDTRSLSQVARVAVAPVLFPLCSISFPCSIIAISTTVWYLAPIYLLYQTVCRCLLKRRVLYCAKHTTHYLSRWLGWKFTIHGSPRLQYLLVVLMTQKRCRAWCIKQQSVITAISLQLCQFLLTLTYFFISNTTNQRVSVFL